MVLKTFVKKLSLITLLFMVAVFILSNVANATSSNYVVVPVFNDQKVYVYNSTGSLLGNITLPDGYGPNDVVIGPSGKLYVTANKVNGAYVDYDQLYIIDLPTIQITENYTLPNTFPGYSEDETADWANIAIDPAETVAFMQDAYYGCLLVWSLTDHDAINFKTDLGWGWDIKSSPDGQTFYVTYDTVGIYHAALLKLDTSGNTIGQTNFSSNGGDGVAISSDGTIAYATDDSRNLSVIDTATMNITRTVTLNATGTPRSVTLSKDDRYVYVSMYQASLNWIQIVDTQGYSVTSIPSIARSPTLQVSSDNTKLYAATDFLDIYSIPSMELLSSIHVSTNNNIFSFMSNSFAGYNYEVQSGSTPITYTINASQTSVTESDTTITLTVTKTGNTSLTSNVTLATVNGSASSPDDFTSINQVLTFLPTESSKTVVLSIKDDLDASEGPEDLYVELSYPTGNSTLGDPYRVRVVIVQAGSATSSDLFNYIVACLILMVLGACILCVVVPTLLKSSEQQYGGYAGQQAQNLTAMGVVLIIVVLAGLVVIVGGLLYILI